MHDRLAACLRHREKHWRRIVAAARPQRPPYSLWGRSGRQELIGWVVRTSRQDVGDGEDAANCSRSRRAPSAGLQEGHAAPSSLLGIELSRPLMSHFQRVVYASVCFFLFSLFFVAEKQQTSYPLEKPAHCRQAHSADPQSARSTVEARGAARRRLRRYMHSVDYCLRCLRTPQMVHRAIDDRRTAFHDEPRNMHPSRLWRD